MGVEIGMMDIDSVQLERVAADARDLATFPGLPSETAVKDFLRKYPFPILFSALSTGSHVAGLVENVVEALEKVFLSPYGRTLLGDVLPYASIGLSAGSPLIRKLSCSTVHRILEEDTLQGADSGQLVAYLLNALSDEDYSVANAATESLVSLAKTARGLDVIISQNGDLFKSLAMDRCSLVRIRALSVAAHIAGVSDSATEAVRNLGILALLEEEISNSSDSLAQITALELLLELAASHVSRFLATGNFVPRLISLIRSDTSNALVRSHAVSVGARLVSTVPEYLAREIIHAIALCLERLDNLERTLTVEKAGEKEAAVSGIGCIASYAYGAEFLLATAVARPVVHAALSPQGGESLHEAAIHSFAAIAGAQRDQVLLSEGAENILRDIVFDVIYPSSLSCKLLYLLQQTPAIRLATYRLLVPLVSRSWCRREIVGSNDIVELIVDPRTETVKDAMEWRHACCVALSTALAAEAVPSPIVEKLNVAVRRGPFLAKERAEAVPLVTTDERF